MTPFILWELTTARQKICRAVQTVDKAPSCEGAFLVS